MKINADPLVKVQASNLSLARISLIGFSGMLLLIFMLASVLIISIAFKQNRDAETRSHFYTDKAVQSLEKSVLLTIKDYAFWGEAYVHLHKTVDIDWAFVRQNIGPTLFDDFGFQGVFVIDPMGSDKKNSSLWVSEDELVRNRVAAAIRKDVACLDKVF